MLGRSTIRRQTRLTGFNFDSDFGSKARWSVVIFSVSFSSWINTEGLDEEPLKEWLLSNVEYAQHFRLDFPDMFRRGGVTEEEDMKTYTAT